MLVQLQARYITYMHETRVENHQFITVLFRVSREMRCLRFNSFAFTKKFSSYS